MDRKLARRVNDFKAETARKISELKLDLIEIETHLEKLYREHMLFMSLEIAEKAATLTEDGHVLSYRKLYRFNRDVVTPMIDEVEAERKALVNQLIDITPPRAIIDHLDLGWAIYMLYKEKYPAVNGQTKVYQLPNNAPAVAYNYVLPNSMPNARFFDANEPIATTRYSYGTAYFEQWSVDKSVVALLAFAPEINTVFFKKHKE